ncbi:GntR family transcriptional regulator [Anaerosphaera multitolerans]|uniref:GntR family transcriptional regulator n=1 Tax=Anaerosphaera multitolerans TaxID=2487351 RepID=A0A437S6V3_9FIRM|nr:GntR family transcriptional regulator [Anaerosphaera multitolerans]RVU54721.1 GntR family transcriptional regulator [Anaerosphaera multitolerans]
MIERKRSTLSSKAYDFLKEKIISGDIKDGDLITENRIGELLNMSRTPVRKALTKLETENYVKCIDGVGSIVIGLSTRDLADIYEVRENIEALALKSSIRRISKTKIENLRQELLSVLELYEKGEKVDVSKLIDLDLRFHNIIIDNSQNNYVKIVMGTIQNQIERYQDQAYILTDTGQETTMQHIEILESIEKQDYEVAKEKLVNHINWSFRTISNAMSSLEIG